MQVLFLMTSLLLMMQVWSHSIGDMKHCRVSQDCFDVLMCTRGEPCECFQFSNQILGSRCVKLSWANKLRNARSTNEMTNYNEDIGPDTCGQDRKKLGKW